MNKYFNMKLKLCGPDPSAVVCLCLSALSCCRTPAFVWLFSMFFSVVQPWLWVWVVKCSAHPWRVCVLSACLPTADHPTKGVLLRFSVKFILPSHTTLLVFIFVFSVYRGVLFVCLFYRSGKRCPAFSLLCVFNFLLFAPWCQPRWPHIETSGMRKEEPSSLWATRLVWSDDLTQFNLPVKFMTLSPVQWWSESSSPVSPHFIVIVRLDSDFGMVLRRTSFQY